jgi:2,4-dienoyl-CoA reductase-like NADH-dependent reductase (Old Yellow Enzyme family)
MGRSQLINQFLDREINRRRDDYGGSAAGRFRFLFECLTKIRQRVPRDFLVGVRLSPEGYGRDGRPGLFMAETLELVERDVDFIHASLWEYWRPASHSAANDQVPMLERFAKHLAGRVPLMVAGKIITPVDAVRVLAMGADVVALGRVAIGNPDWPRLARQSAYEPAQPPFTSDELRVAYLGEAFIDYMKRWPGFVASS